MMLNNIDDDSDSISIISGIRLSSLTVRLLLTGRLTFFCSSCCLLQPITFMTVAKRRRMAVPCGQPRPPTALDSYLSLLAGILRQTSPTVILSLLLWQHHLPLHAPLRPPLALLLLPCPILLPPPHRHIVPLLLIHHHHHRLPLPPPLHGIPVPLQGLSSWSQGLSAADFIS